MCDLVELAFYSRTPLASFDMTAQWERGSVLYTITLTFDVDQCMLTTSCGTPIRGSLLSERSALTS